MKNLYINSRLHPLCISDSLPPLTWRFSLGEPWLLLTPARLKRLIALIGCRDQRIRRLVSLACRHVRDPLRFCRPVGIKPPELDPDGSHPFALCPRCDGVHYPHPFDAAAPCPQCREEETTRLRASPTPNQLRDCRRDEKARARHFVNNPWSFRNGELSPNWRINENRRLERDWDEAARRVAMGANYRQLARELHCSVGLVHRRVAERKHWENN